ncbi:tripartite tricarboxylate transporter TctB family protein [Aureimonas leprariae]|uniref:Tripartite tricarboxylate transporter TctB family protein n=1 Tax=Plantimonas leprariae TaxID=2615207 RepID=A0A7V7PP77_9HYPH|nr:tripartite tricarboxylate transporter TctB family protein [Aureimonas leprariae]KAB0679730.1 tripartite tricarboxylate transporter TctB family protein [Aureimonas leprariae]
MSTVTQTNRNRDLIAGAIFIAIALAFGWAATGYPLGRALRMGPGFIPLVLAVLLVILGGTVIAAGFRLEGRTEVGGVPWKGILLTLVALGIFGYAGPTLGLVPVVFLCGAIVALASTQNGIASALAIALLLSVLSWLVFKVGLAVSLPTIGPVFGPLAHN